MTQKKKKNLKIEFLFFCLLLGLSDFTLVTSPCFSAQAQGLETLKKKPKKFILAQIHMTHRAGNLRQPETLVEK